MLTEKNGALETTTYQYDANGFRTSVEDPLHHFMLTAYNAFGRPTSKTNAVTQPTTITYDANFNIASISDTVGPIRSSTWNPAGLPITVTDARGNPSSNQYDQYGNKTASTDALGRTTNFVYNKLGQKLSQTDPRGNTITFTYDPFGRVKTKTDPLNHTITYAYDAAGNKLSETDANIHTISYVYDAANRLKQVNYPDITTVSYTYDFRGKQLTMTDQLNRVTKNVYDKAGQLTSTTYAFGTSDAGTVSYTYDLAGRKLTETDERSNPTTNGYDAAGRLITVTNAQSKVTTYGYDNANRRTSMLDANNHLTQYVVDARGRRTSVIDPNNKTSTIMYDAIGLVISMEDQEHRITTYTYDKASQLTSVLDALGRLTQYAYDPAGNKTSQTDRANHTTVYAYDAANRRTRRTLPNGVFETNTYDPANNIASRTNFNGKTTTYGYDTLNRQTSRTPDASLTGQTAVVTTYSVTGKRKTMTDASGTTTWNYDNRDRVTSKATPQGTLTYTLDLRGNVTSTASSNTNGVSVSYGYDTLNRLSGVTDNRLSNQTTYAYDNVNNLASFTYPNGVTHAFSLDIYDRPTVLTVTKGASVLASYAQTFSDSGQKLNVVESGGRSEYYSYDPIYRLLAETISGDPIAANNGALNYALDEVGNRQSLISTLTALPSQTATFDANDRLSADTHDPDGNTLVSGGVNYTYDFEDRLLTATGGVVEVYDGDGNRVSSTVAGVTTKFLVDENTVTGYPQVVEETVAGAVTAQYVYGLMRVSQNRGGTVSFYGYDAGGSVRELISNSGLVTDYYAYDAFGNTVARTGSTPNPFQYRGEQFDPSLQMYYLRARYYVARTGRFLQRDHFEGPSLVPNAENAYVYGLSNPVRYSDATGFQATENALTVSLSAEALGMAAPIEVVGEITVSNGVGLAEIEYISAVDKGFGVLQNLVRLSTELGAEVLWIQAVIANGPLAQAITGAAEGGRFGVMEVIYSGAYTLVRIKIP